MNLPTATDKIGHNLAQSSWDLDLAGDEGAAEEADKDDVKTTTLTSHIVHVVPTAE